MMGEYLLAYILWIGFINTECCWIQPATLKKCSYGTCKLINNNNKQEIIFRSEEFQTRHIAHSQELVFILQYFSTGTSKVQNGITL